MDFLNNISAGLLQNVGLGVLTLIVPVGIYVLENKDSNYSELDRNIKIHLINGGNFLIELGWTFLPLIFWDSVGLFVKLVILVAWAFGILLIMKRVAKIYMKWVTLDDKERDEIRQEILRDGKFNENRFISSWSSVWSAKDMGTATEREYLKIFSKRIKEYFKRGDKSNLDMASNLLGIFNSNLDNRDSIFLLVFDDYFPRVLNWHKEVWTKEYNLLGEKDFDLFIIDMLMPAMHGEEMIAKLKTDEKNKSKPIIVLSASVDHKTQKRVEAMGISAFYVKTHVTPSELVEEVKKLTQ